MSDYGKENNSCIMTVTVTVMALTLMRKHLTLEKSISYSNNSSAVAKLF